MRIFLIGTRGDATQYEVGTGVEVTPLMTKEQFEHIGRTIVSMLQKDCAVVHVQKS